jgi:hypothetical protein
MTTSFLVPIAIGVALVVGHFIGGIARGVSERVLADELEASLPFWAAALVEASLRRLAPEDRPGFEGDWYDELDARPGRPVTALIVAARIYIRAGAVRATCDRAAGRPTRSRRFVMAARVKFREGALLIAMPTAGLSSLWLSWYAMWYSGSLVGLLLHVDFHKAQGQYAPPVSSGEPLLDLIPVLIYGVLLVAVALVFRAVFRANAWFRSFWLEAWRRFTDAEATDGPVGGPGTA